MSASALSPQEVSQVLKAAYEKELERCSADICYFIEKYINIEDKGAPGLMVPFKLWDGQKQAVKSIMSHKYNIILKARQLGITWLSVAIAVHTLMFIPGSTVIVLSRTEKEVKELVRRVGAVLAHMPIFAEAEGYSKSARPRLMAPPFTYRITAMEITISSVGKEVSRLHGFLSAPGASRSFSANLIILDEWAFQDCAEEVWTSGYPTINRPDGGGRVIGLSTMKLGTFFNVVWDTFPRFNHIFLPWSTDPARTADWYEETKDQLGSRVFQEYPATVDEAMLSAEGCFFDEFDYAIHTEEPFTPPAHWRRYHAIDYGLDMLASLWGAVDTEGIMHIYREVYAADRIIPDAAADMLSAEEEGEEIYTRICPPDLFGRSSETGRTRAQAFSEEGLVFIKASADREAGWSNLHDWLKPYTDAEGRRTAKIKISKACKNLIRTLRAIQRDEKKPNDCAISPHELTHAPDALRYMMQGWPAAEEKPEKGAFAEYEEAESVITFWPG